MFSKCRVCAFRMTAVKRDFVCSICADGKLNRRLEQAYAQQLQALIAEEKRTRGSEMRRDTRFRSTKKQPATRTNNGTDKFNKLFSWG